MASALNWASLSHEPNNIVVTLIEHRDWVGRTPPIYSRGLGFKFGLETCHYLIQNPQLLATWPKHVTVYSPTGSVPRLSHLTSCSPTKYNIFWHSFPICHERTCRLQTSYIPRTKSHIRLCLLSKEFFQVWDPLWHFVISLFFKVRSCWHHAQPPSWRTTPCRLSTTAYLIYSKLPCISGSRLLHPQPEDMPCRGDKGPTWDGTCNKYHKKLNKYWNV
jgi:hypothetical protein